MVYIWMIINYEANYKYYVSDIWNIEDYNVILHGLRCVNEKLSKGKVTVILASPQSGSF